MKKFRKLIPALAMLLVSAVLMSTASYAWFSMNTQVTATGMQVKAVAEDGLLIINEGDSDAAANWKVSTQATFNSVASLVPTSTADVTKWYHNKSDAPTLAKEDQKSDTYEQLNNNAKWMRDSSTGVQFIDSTSGTDANNTLDASEKGYFLLNKFFIKHI